ncbi:methylated-DNA--[protein]-cysteine S-methyltransferase [Oleiagrimonas soli]|uniref:Methylated-DNA--protein-cysteine methyltransferase n=1 Tax=Oleiagrimonas soli TaxID=1543381 RepID=A0A099CYT5_9GAMM|nr:methylated-DNA--[protein]-cysteine S-methyltransferase [Oleiagrimonas soli]KGI78904.1 hypothetical protein LF63_0102415 [Oleiagrimonas soli]MBB6184402.1 methylated-DNA-[protein]-cysteine S-methyltransferase [Oleiagrimonas soli]
MLYQDRLDTPIGVLTLIADEDGALVRVNLPQSRKPPPDLGPVRADRARLAAICVQFEAYFAGERFDFDLPLRPHGTDFQRQVWDGLLGIGYGRTASYADLARSIGRPRAVRAVGAANGANPLSIIVPCHRVIGADGSLTGYGGGMEAKRWLLDHEQRHRRAA